LIKELDENLKWMKMKAKFLILILMAISYCGWSQVEKTVDSKITGVTVFLNKAQVTRQIKTRVDVGKSNLILFGLTSQLDPQSIQVSGKGNFVILGINHEQNYLNDLNMPKSVKVLKDSLELLQRQLITEQSLKEITNKEEQLLLTNQKIGGNNQNLTVNELKAMADFYRTRLNDILTLRIKQDEKIKKLNERISKINSQLNEQNDLLRRNTSQIIISVSAESVSSAELEVSYVVSNAGWNAVYDIRAINTKSPLQLNYKANVFQRTGEDWNNVKLKLSTANPSQRGNKPELNPWYLNFYNPIVYSPKRYQKENTAPAARMVTSEKAKEEAELAEVQALSDYVVTSQTSINVEFEIGLPYTISSSPKPVIVDIQKMDVKAEYNYAVAPKLDTDAFLIAKATGWEDLNLLPGESNIFFEGTFVGKSYIDPRNTQDTLSFSLGRDKRIVVKRENVKELTSRNIIGSSKKESFTWEITVRNNKAESINIIVEDQVPVSQNSQIEVNPIDTGGAEFNKQTGKLKWTLGLIPSAIRKVHFKFEVKYPKDKIIDVLN
jgi:uncharacterized protein (TIGR02231 family)